ncbi:MAG TPA: endonuclease/exonuclease/phosphatase family protein [Pirellulales bacterium]
MPSCLRNLRRGLLYVALALLLGVAFCDTQQPDTFAAITAIPPWCWLLVSAALGGLGFTAVPSWEKKVFVVLLVVFLFAFVDQSRSVVRLAQDALFRSRHNVALPTLRVVTINCSVGNPLAADEVQAWHPDIVLLQESPNEQAVRQLAQSLFGNDAGVAWSADCTIIARGKLLSANTMVKHFMQATLVTRDGQEVEVFCLRLSPPVVRYDLWTASCWAEHAAMRRKQRQEAAELASALPSVPEQRPILIGGDCNAPARDGALRSWSPRLRDSFATAGRGWGGTVLNEFPAMRFDQLWSSSELQPTCVWSVRSEHSDHRMVVGDFVISATHAE